MKDNDYFIPGKRSLGGNWIKRDNTQLRDIINKGKINTLFELQQNTDLMVINEWCYLQLKHFVENLPQPIRTGDE